MDLSTLQVVTDRFGAALAQVPPERYGDPTPCPDWTVVDLVDHVIGGNRWASMVLAGAEGRSALAEVRKLPVTADRRLDHQPSVTAQREAFEAASPDTPIAHLVGPITAERFLAMRTSDVLIHTWDLCRAVGLDERIPPELVAAGLAMLTPMAGFMAATGYFGPGHEGAPLPTDDQERLLHLTGRRP